MSGRTDAGSSSAAGRSLLGKSRGARAARESIPDIRNRQLIAVLEPSDLDFHAVDAGAVGASQVLDHQHAGLVGSSSSGAATPAGRPGECRRPDGGPRPASAVQDDIRAFIDGHQPSEHRQNLDPGARRAYNRHRMRRSDRFVIIDRSVPTRQRVRGIDTNCGTSRRPPAKTPTGPASLLIGRTHGYDESRHRTPPGTRGNLARPRGILATQARPFTAGRRADRGATGSLSPRDLCADRRPGGSGHLLLHALRDLRLSLVGLVFDAIILLPIALGAWADYTLMAFRARRYPAEDQRYLRERQRLLAVGSRQ